MRSRPIGWWRMAKAVSRTASKPPEAEDSGTKARRLWETLHKCHDGAKLATLMSLTGYSKPYVAQGLNRFKEKGHARHVDDGTWFAVGEGPQGLTGRPVRPRCPTCGQRMPPERPKRPAGGG